MLNNFLGETWNAANKEAFKKTVGSFGEEQLQWIESQLAARKQTFIFTHYPLSIVSATEVKDFGLLPLMKKYADNIHFITAGHWHRWHDFKREFGPQHYVMEPHDTTPMRIWSWMWTSRPQVGKSATCTASIGIPGKQTRTWRPVHK